MVGLTKLPEERWPDSPGKVNISITFDKGVGADTDSVSEWNLQNHARQNRPNERRLNNKLKKKKLIKTVRLSKKFQWSKSARKKKKKKKAEASVKRGLLILVAVEPVWARSSCARLVNMQKALGSPFFLFKNCGLWTLSCDFAPTVNETFKWLTKLPTSMQSHSGDDSVASRC